MSSQQLNKPDDHISLPGSKAEVTTTLGWLVITCCWIIAMATDGQTQTGKENDDKRVIDRCKTWDERV